MFVEEQRKLRKTRETNATRAGRTHTGTEQVNVSDVFGKNLKCVAEFRYLGTLATSQGGATKEINRRLPLATSVFASLGEIWAAKNIPLKLKCNLYKALVMTILLYNGECCTVNARDLKSWRVFILDVSGE